MYQIKVKAVPSTSSRHCGEYCGTAVHSLKLGTNIVFGAVATVFTITEANQIVR